MNIFFPDVKHLCKKWKAAVLLSLSRWNFAFHKAPKRNTNQAITASKHPSFVFLSPSSFPSLSSALMMETTLKVAHWPGNIVYPGRQRTFYCSVFLCLLLYHRREAVYQICRNQTILVFIGQCQTFKIHPEIWRQLLQSTKLSCYVFLLRNQFNKEATDFDISFGF